jgi:hypothetical protein
VSELTPVAFAKAPDRRALEPLLCTIRSINPGMHSRVKAFLWAHFEREMPTKWRALLPLSEDGEFESHGVGGICSQRTLLRSGRANRLDSHWLRVEEEMALKVQSHIDQSDHHGHFHQGPDDSCKCRSRVDPKYRDCHRDR